MIAEGLIGFWQLVIAAIFGIAIVVVLYRHRKYRKASVWLVVSCVILCWTTFVMPYPPTAYYLGWIAVGLAGFFGIVLKDWFTETVTDIHETIEDALEADKQQVAKK